MRTRLFFFFQAEDGIRDLTVTGVQTCALPISTGQGAARRAQSTRARPLQLLRRQRQLSQYAAARRSHEAGLVPMAVPSQPAHALDVGEGWRLAPAVPSPPPTDYGPPLGRGGPRQNHRRARGGEYS